MKKNTGWIFLLCFFLIVLICYLLFVNCQRRIEGLRTVPLPTRYPEPTEYNKRSFAKNENGGMNLIIDTTIGNYFDANHLPYQNTIDLFEQNCINKGNVSNDTMYKLMDVCYYFLDIVIPNIQTVDNPNPSISWPSIKWVSNTWLPLDQTNTTISMSNNSWSYYNINDIVKRRLESTDASYNTGKTIQVNQSDLARLNGLNGIASDAISGSDSTNGSKNVPCDGTIGGDCQIQCPNSCMSNMFVQDQTNKTNGIAGSLAVNEGDMDQKFDWKYYQNMANTFLAGMLTDHLDKKTKFDPRYGGGIDNALGYYTTSSPQTSNDKILDTLILSQINSFFDNQTPTQKLKDMFDMYTKGQSPADDVHIKNLKLLIYYFMSRIIPGLPTNNHPFTYVIWKPWKT